MIAITAQELATVLARGSLREADPRAGVGRELTFLDEPPRRVVVHFGAGDSERYRCDVTDRILALAESWLLVPRHAPVARLGLLAADASAAAIRFAGTERASLSTFLSTRPVDLAAVAADLYAVAVTGNVLLTWDHHTAEEGLEIQLRHVADASNLLAALNELGTELELFYVDQASHS